MGVDGAVVADPPIEKVVAAPVLNNGHKGRLSNGRYIPGLAKLAGAGRPKGSLNKTTIDLREIRDSIVGTWNKAKGNEKLLALAKSDFLAYAKLVLPLMPRATEIHADVPFIGLNPLLHADAAVGFLAALERIAESGKLSQIAVLEALDAHAGGTLEGPVDPDLIETGDAHTVKTTDEPSNETVAVTAGTDEQAEPIETKSLSDNDLEQELG